MRQLALIAQHAGLVAVFLLIFALLLALAEAGFRAGRQAARRRPVTDADSPGIGTVISAMLGLLAFALGLTISLAESRFEARRDLVVNEANTIGTAWLRAGLVEAPEGPAIAASIETYARTRLAFVTTPAGADEAPLIQATNAAQTDIWHAATTLARRAPTPVTATLITALNEMFDAALAERFAFASRVPATLAWSLLAGSIIAMAAVGFQLGLTRTRQPVLTTALVLMWSGGMMVNLDLNEPRLGGIRVNPAPLVWTIASFPSH